jgi:hypothetical protein
MVQKFKVLFLFLVVFWTFVIGCEKLPMVPQESFPVAVTISAVTLDTKGAAISVPVHFNIYRDVSLDFTSGKNENSIILKSDEEGNVEYCHEFFFRGEEISSIVVDVSSPKFESLQYWTAYFSIDDTPAKHVDLILEVVPR